MIKKETPARLANRIEPLNNDILLSLERFEAAIELNGKIGVDTVEAAREYLGETIANVGILSDVLGSQRLSLEKNAEPAPIPQLSTIYGTDDAMRCAFAKLESANSSLYRIIGGLPNYKQIANAHRAFIKELKKLQDDVFKALLKTLKDRGLKL